MVLNKLTIVNLAYVHGNLHCLLVGTLYGYADFKILSVKNISLSLDISWGGGGGGDGCNINFVH